MRRRARLLWLAPVAQRCVRCETDIAAAGYLLRYATDPLQADEILRAGDPIDAVVIPHEHYAAMANAVAQWQPQARLVINAGSTQALIDADLLGACGYYLAQPWFAESSLAVLASAVTSGSEPSYAGVRHGEFTFRTLEQAALLADRLINRCTHRASIVSGVQELLVNAVEHGNLGFGYHEKGSLKRTGRWEHELTARLQDPEYAARYARVAVSREAGELIFTVYDSGSGFDWRTFVEIDLQRLLAPNGRGIALAHMAGFNEITFIGSGNCVRVRLACDIDADVG